MRKQFRKDVNKKIDLKKIHRAVQSSDYKKIHSVIIDSYHTTKVLKPIADDSSMLQAAHVINVLNVVALPILLGIGVDVVIHLLHRLESEGNLADALRTSGGLVFGPDPSGRYQLLIQHPLHSLSQQLIPLRSHLIRLL